MLDTEMAMAKVDELLEEKIGDYEYKVEWLDEYDGDYLYAVTFKFNNKKYTVECDKQDGEVVMIEL